MMEVFLTDGVRIGSERAAGGLARCWMIIDVSFLALAAVFQQCHSTQATVVVRC
jgi:hypothetical protein